jgi:hypothetical protein
MVRAADMTVINKAGRSNFAARSMEPPLEWNSNARMVRWQLGWLAVETRPTGIDSTGQW